MPVSDLTSGFKCFSRRVLEQLDLHSVRSNGYAFQVEMNYRCHRQGFRIAEVPIMFVDRRVGKSKMGSHIVTEAMLVVLGLRFQALTGRSRGGSAVVGARRRPSTRGRLERSRRPARRAWRRRAAAAASLAFDRNRFSTSALGGRAAQAEEVAVRLAGRQVGLDAAIERGVADFV